MIDISTVCTDREEDSNWVGVQAIHHAPVRQDWDEDVIFIKLFLDLILSNPFYVQIIIFVCDVVFDTF